MATWPCRLYIDKSEGHKMQSAGPSVKTHLPRFTSLPPFPPADTSRCPAASGILNMRAVPAADAMPLILCRSPRPQQLNLVSAMAK